MGKHLKIILRGKKSRIQIHKFGMLSVVFANCTCMHNMHTLKKYHMEWKDMLPSVNRGYLWGGGSFIFFLGSFCIFHIFSNEFL